MFVCFSVNQVGDTYVEGMASLNLLCEIKGGVTPDVDRSISWMRDSKPITASGDKYKIHTNNSTLEIVNPGLFCSTFTPCQSA